MDFNKNYKPGHRILLIDVDSHNFPNLVLMKLSAFFKAKKCSVSFLKLTSEDKRVLYNGQLPFFKDEFDYIYGTCVFEENAILANVLLEYGVFVAGTGLYIDSSKTLPKEIEKIYPDYDLYKIENTAYGFLTRGCPRCCPFCIISKKEGAISKKVANLKDFWNGQKFIKLLDPNILACDKHLELLEELIESKAYIDFTQGLDARLTDKTNIKLLQQIKVKAFHFAWDNPRDEKIKEKFLFIRNSFTLHPRYFKVYVLTNYWSNFNEDLKRIYWLRDNGLDPYVMIYDKNNAPKNIRYLQRWVNNKRIFNTVDKFEDYDHKRG